MQTGANPRVRSRARSLLVAVAVAAAVLVAFPSPADAHGRGSSWRGPRGAAHGHHKKVPRFIAVERHGDYHPYLSGRVYYAPHHHHHVRYRFPVFVNGVVVHRPYDYCGGRLFVTGAVTLPHLAIGAHFGSPGGFFVGGYYAPVVTYQPVDLGHEVHYLGCGHEWDD